MTLAELIESATRSTPGVISLFAATPTGALVSISASAVAVNIAVDAAAQAPETAAAVGAAIRSLAPHLAVSVRVSRVA